MFVYIVFWLTRSFVRPVSAAAAVQYIHSVVERGADLFHGGILFHYGFYPYVKTL